MPGADRVRAAMGARPPARQRAARVRDLGPRCAGGGRPGRQRPAGRSGIAAFQTALTQFLTTEQGRVSLRNVAAGAVGLVGRQLRDLRAGRLADDGGPHPDARSPRPLTLAAPADRALTGETVATSARDLMQAARDTLEQDGRKITSSWLERRAAEVHEAIISEAGGDIGALLDLARSPRVLGAEIAGLATAGGGGRDGPAGWSAEEVPGLAAPLVFFLNGRPAAAGRTPVPPRAGYRRR